MVWVIAGGVTLYGLIVLVALLRLRFANLEDLLVLLLWRRAGKPPPQVSQYQGFL